MGRNCKLPLKAEMDNIKIAINTADRHFMQGDNNNTQEIASASILLIITTKGFNTAGTEYIPCAIMPTPQTKVNDKDKINIIKAKGTNKLGILRGDVFTGLTLKIT